jgi:hypothetical protein
VLTHLPFFLAVEWTGLQEDRVSHPDLADVVNESAAIKSDQVRILETEAPSEAPGGVRHSLGVTRGELILRLGRCGERKDELLRVGPDRKSHGPLGLRGRQPKVAMQQDGVPALIFRGSQAP